MNFSEITGLSGIFFMVALLVIFGLIFLLRIAKFGTVMGSLASTMQGGIPIIDKAGSGDIAEVITYDQHPLTKKIKLRLNYIDKFTEGQTGYWFDEEDFYPTLKSIAGGWDNYHGTILLYKDFSNECDYRNNSIKSLTEEIKQLKNMVSVYQRVGVDMINKIEKKKISDEHENEMFTDAKRLKVLKSIVNDTDTAQVDNTSKGDSMFD